MKLKYQKIAVILMICSIFSITAVGNVFAATSTTTTNPDITTGLTAVTSTTLATKIVTIAVSIGALAGGVAAIVLVVLGFKLKSGNERARAETIEQIKYVFIGLGVVGLAIAIVGFFTSIIKVA